MPSEKFKAMVHYIVASCEDPHTLGATRLNKICWFADTLAYRFSHQTITEEKYVKRQHGPVPKSILPTLRELETEGKIHIREHHYLPQKKIRLFVALTDAPKDQFSAEQLAQIDFVMQYVCKHTANEISELSHDAIWDAANDGEEIPMEATLVSGRAEFTPAVKAWAERMVGRVDERRNVA